MNNFLNNPMFGILLSLAAFELGLWLQRKTKLQLLNPLLIAIITVIAVLTVFQIDLSVYQTGGAFINMFLGPATVVMAVPLFRQLRTLRNFLFPILIGVTVGSVVGILSTILCSVLLHFPLDIIASLVPKSITTPIGIAVSSSLNGIPAVTVLAILVTGIAGNCLAEPVCRLFRLEHPVAVGVAIGTSSHAVGTSKAIQIGHIEGAMSSLAIGVAGIITVFLAPLLWQWLLPLIQLIG